MTNEQFAYWLQGYAEICGTEPTAEQWQIIKDHLQLVFQKVTPMRGIPTVGQPISWPSSPSTITPMVTCIATPQMGAASLC